MQKGRHVRGVIPRATDCSRFKEKGQDGRPSSRLCLSNRRMVIICAMLSCSSEVSVDVECTASFSGQDQDFVQLRYSARAATVLSRRAEY